VADWPYPTALARQIYALHIMGRSHRQTGTSTWLYNEGESANMVAQSVGAFAAGIVRVSVSRRLGAASCNNSDKLDWIEGGTRTLVCGTSVVCATCWSTAKLIVLRI
jgi:hypothetical protein